jgi:peptidoglycan/xylan/chitin deacetylase (PgdA/CDA1 family)
LKKYDFKATFYIIGNSVGKWYRMFWNDILILAEEGRDIGSHSMNHKKLKLSDEEMKYLFENEFTSFPMKDVVYDD